MGFYQRIKDKESAMVEVFKTLVHQREKAINSRGIATGPSIWDIDTSQVKDSQTNFHEIGMASNYDEKENSCHSDENMNAHGNYMPYQSNSDGESDMSDDFVDALFPGITPFRIPNRKVNASVSMNSDQMQEIAQNSEPKSPKMVDPMKTEALKLSSKDSQKLSSSTNNGIPSKVRGLISPCVAKNDRATKTTNQPSKVWKNPEPSGGYFNPDQEKPKINVGFLVNQLTATQEIVGNLKLESSKMLTRNSIGPLPSPSDAGKVSPPVKTKPQVNKKVTFVEQKEKMNINLPPRLISSGQNQKTNSIHSRPKSAVGKKSFEEWSSERFSAKTLSQENLTSPSTTTVTPSVPIPTKDLYDLETDYFYGVKSDFMMDSENVLSETEWIGSSASNGNLCRISELMEKFVDDENDPLSHDFHCLLTRMKEQQGYGGKRKSTATHLSPIPHSNHKRNRQDSSSLPQSRSRYNKDYLATSDAMINLQVMDNKENKEEMLVLGMEIFEIKENYPLIFNIIPAVELEEITLPYRANVMAIALRCIFQAPYTITSWDVAVEVYALAKEYSVQQLINKCEIYFMDNPIKSENVGELIMFVKQFQIEELLQYAHTTCTNKRPTFPDLSQTVHCTISCTVHKEEMELAVPLIYSKGDLGGIRKSDLKSEMEIEAVRGVHTITAVNLKLEIDLSDKGKRELYCEVIKGKERLLDIEMEVELQKNTVINFDRKICLGPKEAIKIIIIMEDMKSSWCHCLREEKAEFESRDGLLRAKFRSAYKTSERRSLFFIDKVFYKN